MSGVWVPLGLKLSVSKVDMDAYVRRKMGSSLISDVLYCVDTQIVEIGPAAAHAR